MTSAVLHKIIRYGLDIKFMRGAALIYIQNKEIGIKIS